MNHVRAGVVDLRQVPAGLVGSSFRRSQEQRISEGHILEVRTPEARSPGVHTPEVQRMADKEGLER